MEDHFKLPALVVVVGIVAAYWSEISRWLTDVEAGIIRLSSLLDIEPTGIIFILGIILFLLYANR